MNKDRYGAAVHEAGHVVVARAFGLKCSRLVAGIGGDDTAGKVDIDDASHLAVIDQIAICSAGIDTQRLLGAPTNDNAGFSDMNKIRDLVEDYADTEGEALRYVGYRRSWELLKRHRATVERLAAALAERGELDHADIERIVSNV